MIAIKNIKPVLITRALSGLKVSSSELSNHRAQMDGSRRRFNSVASDAEASPISYNYDTLKVEMPHEYVYHVEVNRPKKMNSINKTLWREMRECFAVLARDPGCRSVVLSGAGKLFSAGYMFQSLSQLNCSFKQNSTSDSLIRWFISTGLDLTDAADLGNLVNSDIDIARRAMLLKNIIMDYQNSFTAIEKCPKPVIAAIHNACIGAGVSMVSACDIRYCTNDAWFTIKEIDIGLAADVGALQRITKTVGNDSLARELAFTGRNFTADEALQFGFVSRLFSSKEELMKAALELAKLIAAKSPVAMQGTKVNMNYSRDHAVDEALHFMAHWNMSMLLTEDIMKSVMATMDKSGDKPVFSKL